MLELFYCKFDFLSEVFIIKGSLEQKTPKIEQPPQISTFTISPQIIIS